MSTDGTGTGPAPAAAGADPTAAQGARGGGSVRIRFAAMVLALEACVAGFATLVAFGLRVAEPRVVWTLGGAFVASLVIGAGVVRRPGGVVVGSVLQVAVVASGIAVPMMYVVGGLFAGMWLLGLRLGARIDRERAEREVAEAAAAAGAGEAAEGAGGPDGVGRPGDDPSAAAQ